MDIYLFSKAILFDKNGMQIKAELLIKSTEATVKVTLMNVTPVNLTDVSYQVSVPKVKHTFSIEIMFMRYVVHDAENGTRLWLHSDCVQSSSLIPIIHSFESFEGMVLMRCSLNNKLMHEQSGTTEMEIQGFL